MTITRMSLSGKQDLDEEEKNSSEEDVAEFFGDAFEEQFQQIIDQINTTDPESLPNSFWEGWGGIFTAFLLPEFTGFQLTSAESAMKDLAIGVDWDLVIDNAQNFSSSHVFSLVTDINNSSQRHLQNALTNFFNTPEDVRSIEDLTANIATRFGATRAENIAITEVTRGFERGKDIYRDQLARLGIRTEPRWHTLLDERVCIICEPNEGLLKSEGWTADGIPAHPRDRCWTTIEVVEAVRSWLATMDRIVTMDEVKTWLAENMKLIVEGRL